MLHIGKIKNGLKLQNNSRGGIGAEIKFRKEVYLQDAKALIAIREKAENWLGGFIVYQGSEIKLLDKDIWAIPSWRLFS